MKKIKAKDEPLSMWNEKESIHGDEVDSLVCILNGPGCSWSKRSGCLMCGYNNDVTNTDFSKGELIAQIDHLFNRYDGEPYIKIYTSGSFLDTNEIPFEVQRYLAEQMSEVTTDVKLLVESRPEFVNEGNLKQLIEKAPDLEIAIGLETQDDHIRNKLVRKGFLYADYLKAGRKIEKLDIELKTYLLLKPPLLGENNSIIDCIGSIKRVAKDFKGTKISVNPMNVQQGTVVEDLYKMDLYTPPWIRSVVEVLKQGCNETEGEVKLMSSPTGGGKRRGVHNCGSCDASQLDLIRHFSLRNDPNILDTLSGCCSDEWREHMVASINAPMAADKFDPRR